jgi:hypothetical protein
MKKRKPRIIKDPKLRGEWVESVFMARAGEHGLPVSRPWGEMSSYDFVVGKTGRFASVQVKSTISVLGTGFTCTVRGGHKAYPPGAFDFLAVYVVLEDAWYIIPAKLIWGKRAIMLYPNSPKTKYEKYREAWHLLREAAELGRETESGADVGDAESGASRVASESASEESAANEPGASGAAAGEPVRGRFPASALARMEAVENYARRYLEGNYPRPQKEREDG